MFIDLIDTRVRPSLEGLIQNTLKHQTHYVFPTLYTHDTMETTFNLVADDIGVKYHITIKLMIK